ncbi:MAG: type II secretion system protein [Candidatus Schekmanbacteria bacterium]|nr:type II secretion system protein [Candidatus Schekmanbacteria bacterium]
MSRLLRTARGERGFTILETLIALVILCIATGSIAALYPQAMGRISNTERRSLAVVLTNQYMNRIETTRFTDIAAITNNAALPKDHPLYGPCATFDPCEADGSGTIFHDFGTVGGDPLTGSPPPDPTYHDFRVAVTVQVNMPPTVMGDIRTVTIRTNWLFPGIDPDHDNLPRVQVQRRIVSFAAAGRP